MPILNRSSPGTLRDFLNDVQQTRGELLLRRQLEGYEESLGRLFMESGLISYALDEPMNEVRSDFAESADHLSRALASRGEPDSSENRNPWEAEQFLNVIGAFGTATDLRRIGNLRASQMCSPTFRASEAIGRYVTILSRFLAEGGLDVLTLAEVLEACDRANASRIARWFLRPAARGLLAVNSGDVTGWNEAVAALVAAHRREAHSGDLQFLPAGLLSLRGLMLARLGIDRSMRCRAISEFVPLDLLEGKGWTRAST